MSEEEERALRAELESQLMHGKSVAEANAMTFDDATTAARRAADSSWEIAAIERMASIHRRELAECKAKLARVEALLDDEDMDYFEQIEAIRTVLKLRGSAEYEAAVSALMKCLWGYRNDKRWRDAYEALRSLREKRGIRGEP